MNLLVALIIVSILMWLLPMGIALWRGVDDLGMVFMISILCLILPLLWFAAIYVACAFPKRLPPQRAQRHSLRLPEPAGRGEGRRPPSGM